MERPAARVHAGTAGGRSGRRSAHGRGRAGAGRGRQVDVGAAGRRTLFECAPVDVHSLGHRHTDRASGSVRRLQPCRGYRRHRQAGRVVARCPGVAEPRPPRRSAADRRRRPRSGHPVGHAGLPIGACRHRSDGRYRTRGRGTRRHRGAVDRRSAGPHRRRRARCGNHHRRGRHVHRRVARRGAGGARLSGRRGAVIAGRPHRAGRRRCRRRGPGLGCGRNPGARRTLRRTGGLHRTSVVRRARPRGAGRRRRPAAPHRSRPAAVKASAAASQRPAPAGIRCVGQRCAAAGGRSRRRGAAGAAARRSAPG